MNKSYVAVVHGTPAAGNLEGVNVVLEWNNKDDFDAWITDNTHMEVVEKGITMERGRELVDPLQMVALLTSAQLNIGL